MDRVGTEEELRAVAKEIESEIATSLPSSFQIRVGIAPKSDTRPSPVAVVAVMRRSEKTPCLTGKSRLEGTLEHSVSTMKSLVRATVMTAEAFLSE
jgi:hypothetical protein